MLLCDKNWQLRQEWCKLQFLLDLTRATYLWVNPNNDYRMQWAYQPPCWCIKAMLADWRLRCPAAPFVCRCHLLGLQGRLLETSRAQTLFSYRPLVWEGLALSNIIGELRGRSQCLTSRGAPTWWVDVSRNIVVEKNEWTPKRSFISMKTTYRLKLYFGH